MKLKYSIAAIAATTLGANAAVMTIDNISNVGDNAYGEGNYDYQSFIPTTAGTGATDNVTAITAGGINSAISLQTITLITASNGNEGTAGDLYLNIYVGDADFSTGNYVGSSINAEDLRTNTDHAQFSEVTWTFASLGLDKDTQYTAVLSSTNAVGDLDATNRLRARRVNAFPTSNDFDTYLGGQNSAGNHDIAFAATFDVTEVPEPSSAALLGLGGLALILRRRK